MVNRATSERSIHLMEGSSVFSSPLTCGSPTMMESWGPGRTGTPPPALPPPPAGSNNGGATSAATATVAQPSTTAPIASPEGVSDVSEVKPWKKIFNFKYPHEKNYSLSLSFPLHPRKIIIFSNLSQSETTIESLVQRGKRERGKKKYLSQQGTISFHKEREEMKEKSLVYNTVGSKRATRNARLRRRAKVGLMAHT